MPFSNIFNRIRGHRRVGIAPEGLPPASPLAVATPIGSVIPQGVAITNRQAQALPEAFLESSIINPIINTTRGTFRRELWNLVQDDIGYHRYITPPNFPRFRLAYMTEQGITALYEAFLSSIYATVDFVMPDFTEPLLERRLREFYRNYRGDLDIPSRADIRNEEERRNTLRRQEILVPEYDYTAF
jgi:hypothetical protein